VEEKRGLSAAVRTALLAAAVLLLTGQGYGEPEEAAPPPSFEELEALGAIIGTIRVDPRNIFDLSDPKENSWPYRLANSLHVRTRPETVAKQLLFKTGDRVSARAIAESCWSSRSDGTSTTRALSI